MINELIAQWGGLSSTEQKEIIEFVNGRVRAEKRKAGFDYSKWPNMPDPQILEDWIALRKRLKANVTQTVINRFGKQLTIAVEHGFTVDECMEECVTRNWKGFEYAWMVKNEVKPEAQSSESWRDSYSGIVKKGSAIGLREVDFENFQDFKRAVFDYDAGRLQ